MNQQNITPVILSGGAGTRLWPLSRSEMPKQMLRLIGDDSLIQSAARRAPSSEGFMKPVVVAGASHRAHVERQMAEIGVSPHAIILEPAGRNTAPAIALAAFELDADALMLIMPSDQAIADVAAFRSAIAAAAPLAAAGWLVTFGVTPDRPETGYGYIEAADSLGPGVQRVARFVEKPDAATARAYVDSGKFFWNAGIFLIRAGTYLDALREHAPAIEAAVRRSLAGAARDGNMVMPDAAFLTSPSDSIDYAIMEKVANVAVAPVDMGWSDIGAFAALWEQLPRDADGNAIVGDVVVRGGRNCLLRSDGPVVAVVGVSDLSVIATGDAVLVVAHDKAQDVKHIADALKQAGRGVVDRHASEFAAWGVRRRLGGEAGLDAYLYEIAAGAAVPVSAAAGGHAILISGSAVLDDRLLERGQPRPIAGGSARLSAAADAPATVVVTISAPRDDIG